MAAAPGSRHFRLQLQQYPLTPGPRPALLPPLPRFSPSLRPCQLPRVPAATKGRGKGKRRGGRGREPGTGAGEGKGGARGTGRVSESPQQQQHRPDTSPQNLHRAPTAAAASRALPGSPTNFITLHATYPTSRRHPPIVADRSTRPANHSRGRGRYQGPGWAVEGGGLVAPCRRRSAAPVFTNAATPGAAGAAARGIGACASGAAAPWRPLGRRVPAPFAVELQPSQSSSARGLPCELQYVHRRVLQCICIC